MPTMEPVPMPLATQTHLRLASEFKETYTLLSDVKKVSVIREHHAEEFSVADDFLLSGLVDLIKVILVVLLGLLRCFHYFAHFSV